MIFSVRNYRGSNLEDDCYFQFCVFKYNQCSLHSRSPYLSLMLLTHNYHLLSNCSFLLCVISYQYKTRFFAGYLYSRRFSSNTCHYFFPLAVSVDLSAFPNFTFSEVEAYAQKESGCRHTTKGFKFFAGPRYLHESCSCLF